MKTLVLASFFSLMMLAFSTPFVGTFNAVGLTANGDDKKDGKDGKDGKDDEEDEEDVSGPVIS